MSENSQSGQNGPNRTGRRGAVEAGGARLRQKGGLDITLQCDGSYWRVLGAGKMGSFRSHRLLCGERSEVPRVQNNVDSD